MAFRFQRRVTLFPGLRLNFGKTGVSVSAGIRGASVTAGKRGIYGNVGAPGTGMSYRTRLDNAPAHRRRVQRSQHQVKGNTGLSQAGGSSTQGGHVELKCDARGKLTIYGEGGQPASPALVRHIWANHKKEVQAFLQSELERINDDHSLLLEIHHDTPAPDTPPPAFYAMPFSDPQPNTPDLPSLPDKPTPLAKRWWHALIPPLERRRITENQLQHAKWQQEHARISAVREAQKAEYQQQHDTWQQGKAEHEAVQQQLADAFDDDLRNDPDFMAQVLESELAQLDWPRETHVDFDIEGTLIKLDVDFPTADEFPSREARFNKSGKRLLVKDKSATQQRKEYAQHVHGVVFRLIGVVFATLPAIEHAQIAGYTQAINTATGHEEDEYLIQVKLSRVDWSALNLAQPERIDPIVALEQFELAREMSKTGIFRALDLESV
ncbi:MAG: DUF4236 domain-containing protein [Idiomarina sp.]|nr:DUF4236 domain-containing protein [Idiomarina sp.]